MRTRTLGMAGGVLLAAALLLGTFGTALAQVGGPFGSGWGPGGMMGGGWGMGGMMGGWSSNTTSPSGTPITIAQAKQAVDGYLASYGDPNLKISEVMEFQNNFYAIASEKDTGKGAMELLVNKGTGAVFPEYGPNMMWNTKYGHMGGLGGGMMGGWWGGAPSGQATVTADQAKSLAQKWLDSNMSGSTTGDIDTFYGYYTLHSEKDGKITGMLSVNAYTGQVWYHTWHGNFIQMQSY